MKTLFLFLCLSLSLGAQSLQNPILFVTAVPTPIDSLTQTAAFGSHQGAPLYAPRGGDLYIRYADGSMKCLTAAAGFGNTGLQGSNSIAVREPSVHWSGTKALFSMVVGASSSKNDTTRFVWQIYEITGLQKSQTPIITKVANQPLAYNNLSPIYGTDDRVIFTSDQPRAKKSFLYPRLDEYKTAPTNTGLWSLDPQSGDMFQLDDAVSGDFSPTFDSYGRLIFIRWDHLQRDHLADVDVMQSGTYGSFNYSDESAKGVPQYLQRSEFFPEPQGIRTDILNGTNMNGFEFNIFMPWQINEDGSSAEIMNHMGRHDFRQVFGASIKDDPQVVQFNMSSPARNNQFPITNIMQIKEDPLNHGTYYAVDANQNGTHGGGQVIRFNAAPGLDPNQMVVSYITHRSTSFYTFEGSTPNVNHSGFYRGILPTTDGKLIASHSVETHADKNIGTFSSPLSRYDFRLKFLTQSGSVMIGGTPLTTGISKQVSFWTTDTLLSYNGNLWELDAVELVARNKPARREYSLAAPEAAVFADEQIDTTKFRSYLRTNGLAVISSRDVTMRDKFDKQQPFNLRVAGTQHAHSNGGTGKVYDVAYLQLLQSDHIRGYGMTTASSTPMPGRRILAQPLRDVSNAHDSLAPQGAVNIQSDGSYAAFVPAQRAMTWQLVAPDGTPVVRERYWVTLKAGEIRSCAMCHGTNSESLAPQDSVPQNKPEALRGLLHTWRQNNLPQQVLLQSPANNASNQVFPIRLQWKSVAKATGYVVSVLTTINNKTTTVTRTVDMVTTSATFQQSDFPAGAIDFRWSVVAQGDWGDALASDTWQWSLQQAPAPIVELISPTNNSSGVVKSTQLKWKALGGATSYNLQVSTSNTFASTVMNSSGASTQALASNLQDSTLYFWRVQAQIGSSTSAWSEVWSFVTAAKAQVLAAATLISPPDGSKKIPIPSQVSWQGPPEATSYTVQIAQKADFSDAQSGDCSQSPVRFSSLAPATTYYWRVQAKNNQQTANWSEAWSFTTAESANDVIDPAREGALSLDPQPVDHEAALVYTADADEVVEVQLTNLRGQIVYRQASQCQDGKNTLHLDCSALTNGVYVVSINGSHKTQWLKFVIEH